MRRIALYATILLASCSSLSQVANASCRNYPKKRGVEVVEVPNGIKILSTYMATVPIDDAELYMDALEEAETEAKVEISKFMSENVAKACEKDTTKIRNVKVTGEGKSVDYQKIKIDLCSVSTQTQALLKGAQVVGDCYTPGKFVMVTVGIKPRTIANARKLSNNLKGRSGNSSGSSSSGSTGYTNIDGYSNTDRLDNF